MGWGTRNQEGGREMEGEREEGDHEKPGKRREDRHSEIKYTSTTLNSPTQSIYIIIYTHALLLTGY